jgi:hypothetical protein
MADKNGNNEQIDYLSLDGLVSEDTKAWTGESMSIPKGDYLGKLIDFEKGVSSNNNSQLICQIEVLEDTVGGEYKGRKMRAWYTLTKNAIGRLLNLLKACGQELDKKGGFSMAGLKGQTIVFGVQEDIVEGDQNPMTGKKDTRVFSKVFNERPAKEWTALLAKAQAEAKAADQAKAQAQKSA